MGILRSERMKHGTLVLPMDRARDFLDLLGEKTNMQFEDMNTRDMHRPYKRHIQRIDELDRIIRFLSEEVRCLPEVRVIKGELDHFLAHSASYRLDEVESHLKRIYADFVQFKENSSKLIIKRNAALEETYVVKTGSSQTGHRIGRSRVARGNSVDVDDETEDSGLMNSMETMFSNVAGVIPQTEQDRFARALFRATRGNTYTHFQQFTEPMQDPKTNKPVPKAVFVIYFQDSRGGFSRSAMGERVRRICNSFGVNMYTWPGSKDAAEERLVSLGAQVADAERLLKAQRGFVLEAAETLIDPPRTGANSLIEEWRLFCLKEKAIYATLNFFEGRTNLRANCWYPADEEDQIRALLIQHSARVSGAMLVSDRVTASKKAPTYIRPNEFTIATQTLINLYGSPRYQEANPMPLSLVTFPFLFGVMYGDVGHGTLLFLFGLFCVWQTDKIKHISILYNGRYMITMMGFFGIYAGFMYNDFFSVGLDLFGSRWRPTVVQQSGKTVHIYEPVHDTKNMGGDGPYPFGIDPAWHGASNELMFVNSLKMKLSVILGVAQMIVGLLLRFMNSVHDLNALDFFCECVPMMIFMLCFFGFMDYMILYKWVTTMDNPPSIINSLIAMAMGQKDPAPMFGDSLPKMLMGITMLTVPWMLIPKPLLLHRRNKSRHSAGGVPSVGYGAFQDETVDDEEEQSCIDTKEDEEEHHSFGDVMIHQTIETIEYVLGTVSHTASYLRLWALSLAHQQLSLVFFQKTIISGMAASFPFNVIGVYVMFAFWFMITMAVLMGMDVMECVLHVLRLHWIEFQSKFYKADGHIFVPFHHKDTLDDADGGL